MDKHPFDGWVMVICNPVSGAGRGLELLTVVRRAFDGAGLAYACEVSRRRGDAARLSRSALQAGCSAVVTIGGDGTFFEVLNGAFHPVPGREPREAGVAFGLVQAGRGSDFGRSAGIPADVQGACARLLAAGTVPVDLCRVSYTSFSGRRQERVFANAAGLGFDAEVTVRANAGPRVLGGTVPYLSALLTTLGTYRNKRISVKADGAEGFQGRANSIVVANGQYFGGGMRIAPDASLSDGRFDVVLLGDLSKLELVMNVPKVYDGSHITHPKVHVTRAESVQVLSPDSLLLQADGEVLGTAPAEFSIVPGAIRLIT